MYCYHFTNFIFIILEFIKDFLAYTFTLVSVRPSVEVIPWSRFHIFYEKFTFICSLHTVSIILKSLL